MGRKFAVLFLILFFLCGPACADRPAAHLCSPAYNARKVFSLGRSAGASYFHLIDLSSKAGHKPFSELQREYNNAFQNLNIIDIILDDLAMDGKSRQGLNKLRINLYHALKKQDLSETHIAFVRDMFVIFYEDLARDVSDKYCFKGSWLLSLGFYASFQLESLNSPEEEKLLLSGFSRILSARPFSVPQNVYMSLLTINELDKLSVTRSELVQLKNNLTVITEYFTNYPGTRPLIAEIQDLAGVWQGIVINPENEKHDIRLRVNKDLTATMAISGIAGEVEVSDIRIVNNYFTFMFKPFGTEKLYLRFDARLSENIFTGEITDVLGAKGYWVLAKTNENLKLSEENLDTMVSYIARVEEKLKQAPKEPVVPVNTVTVEREVEQEQSTEKKGRFSAWMQFFRERFLKLIGKTADK